MQSLIVTLSVDHHHFVCVLYNCSPNATDVETEGNYLVYVYSVKTGL